ncbi:MAG TPA: M81 family metallopeptidase [Clostridia bacterium]|nr:M81 family metallopeptidase [Clostridia bacterium]
MKIVICEFNQETNSFNPITTTMDDYKRGGIFEGEEMRTELEGRPCAVAGMFRAIKEAKAEAIPAYSMYAQSGGPVEQEILDKFIEKTVAVIRKSAPVDGVFISFHGATQSTEYDDVCGLISEIVRKEVGEGAVIAASCDLHANVTERMVQNLDIVCGYHTYPHSDFFETGYRAGKLGMECLIDKVRYHMVRVMLPMIAPASSYTTLMGSFANIMAYGELLQGTGKLIDFSIFQMQPWLDVANGGSAVLTIAYDYKTAEPYAIELAQRLLDMREEFNPKLYSIDQVLDLAVENKTGKPVILVDSADSTNAGAVGDNASVLKRLLERKLDIKMAFAIDDAPAAELAHNMGVGKKGIFSIGGTKDPARSESVQVEAYVKSLHDGVFSQEGPAGRGLVRDIGRTAVLSIGNIDVVVCHRVMGNGDPQLYRAFGVEPTFYQLVVVKACTSFRVAYQLLAAAICDTDTPGTASVHLMSLNFKKIPHSFYPFSSLNDYKISDITYARAIEGKRTELS